MNLFFEIHFPHFLKTEKKNRKKNNRDDKKKNKFPTTRDCYHRNNKSSGDFHKKNDLRGCMNKGEIISEKSRYSFVCFFSLVFFFYIVTMKKSQTFSFSNAETFFNNLSSADFAPTIYFSYLVNHAKFCNKLFSLRASVGKTIEIVLFKNIKATLALRL